MKRLMVSIIIVWMFLMSGCASNAIFPDNPQKEQTNWIQGNAAEVGIAGVSTIPGLEYSFVIYKLWKNSQHELQGEVK